jgi:GT2 family glycosyltransferase
MAAAEPAVSVIILGYNGEDYVDSCLPSVLDQDFDRPYEVLLVDNGSWDRTAAAAERYAAAHANVTVHRLGKNYGFCQGNNRGAALAKAPLLVFLNQDVLVHRSWLRALVTALESDPAIKAAHANVIQPWNPEYAPRERQGPVAAAYAPELSRLGYVVYESVGVEREVVDTLFVSGVSTALKRDALEELGGYVFDPDMFAYGEDMDLGLRIRTAGYRAVVATRAVLYHHHRLDDRISIGSFLKTVRIIRNRLIALWKASDWLEFVPLASVAVVGAPFNAGQFGLPAGKKVLYFLLLVPPTVTAAVAAGFAMPRYAGRRREILSRRRVGRWWLLRTLVFDRSKLGHSRVVEPAAARS